MKARNCVKFLSERKNFFAIGSVRSAGLSPFRPKLSTFGDNPTSHSRTPRRTGLRKCQSGGSVRRRIRRRLEALTPQACRVCTTGLPRRHGGMTLYTLLYITQTRGNQSQRRRPEHRRLYERPPFPGQRRMSAQPFLRTPQTERRPGTENKRRRKHAPSEQPDAAGEAQSGGSDGQKSTGHGRRDCGSSCIAVAAMREKPSFS